MPTNSIRYRLTALPETAKPSVPSRRQSRTAEVTDPITFGRGVLAPLRRDGKGDFANSADIVLVRSEVRQVLNTLSTTGGLSDGELPWRPEFGSALALLRFRNLDETTVELARTYVVDALKTWLLRVRVRSATINPDTSSNTLEINVVYDILANNQRSIIAQNIEASVAIPVAGP